MTCCEPTIYPFSSSTLTIDYGAQKQADYGSNPNVEVYIKEGSEYVLSEFVEVRLSGGSIEIDFGGPAVGVVKVF